MNKTTIIRTLRAVCVSALFLAVAAPVSAQEEVESPLVSELKAFLVVTVDTDDKAAADKAQQSGGKLGEQMTETESVAPGGVIEYQLTYTNRSEEPLRSIVADGVIPEQTNFIEGSLRGPKGIRTLFSIDAGVTFSVPPVYYTEKDEEGRAVRKVATPDMYERIRWEIPALPGGKSVELAYRVEVL